MENLLIKIKTDGDFLAISTYGRKAKYHGRFLTDFEKLAHMENGDYLFDRDCGNIMQVFKNGGKFTFTFWWMNTYGDDTFKGIQQTFSVNEYELLSVNYYQPLVFLRKKTETGKAMIDSLNAGRTIRNICKDKRMKRAFCKAMRDNFNWNNDVVRLYSDGNHDFFFKTEGSWNINGGLILHNAPGRTGFKYGIHT